MFRIGEFDQYIGMTKLARCTPAGQVFSTQRIKKAGIGCQALLQIDSKGRNGTLPVKRRADPIRISIAR
jgi:hypothetical protein